MGAHEERRGPIVQTFAKTHQSQVHRDVCLGSILPAVANMPTIQAVRMNSRTRIQMINDQDFKSMDGA